jgi:hypothetical protein
MKNKRPKLTVVRGAARDVHRETFDAIAAARAKLRELEQALLDVVPGSEIRRLDYEAVGAVNRVHELVGELEAMGR